MLVGVLAGGNPVSGTFPFAAVVISGGGAGDQSVESPETRVPVGWVKACQLRQGGEQIDRSETKANRSQAPK